MGASGRRLRRIARHVRPPSSPAPGCPAAPRAAPAASAAPTAAGLPTAEQVAKFHEQDGVLVFPDMIPEAAFADVNAALEPLIEEFVTAERPPRAERQAIYREKFDTEVLMLPLPLARGAALSALLKNERLMAATEALLGPDYKFKGAFTFATEAGMGHGWHQDSGSDEPGQYEINRLIYPRSLRPGEGGTLRFVPGSFRLGHMTLHPGPNHGPIEGEVEIVPKAGTVVILHTRCFHRVSHFTGARPRIVINSRCSPAGARADVTRFPVFRSQTWDHQTGLPWDEDDLRGDATS